MASLTAEEVHLRDVGDMHGFYRSLARRLATLRDHWWCHAPALVIEILPYLALRPPPLPLSILRLQLAKCRRCATAYHDAVVHWRASATVSCDEADTVVGTLRDWDAYRLVPSLASLASRICLSEGAEQNPFAFDAETALHEILLDVRLALRGDVAHVIMKLFSVLSPQLPSRTVNVPPGLFALVFYSSTEVASWARRALAGRSVTISPPGLKRLLRAVLDRLVSSSPGGSPPVVDLTADDHNDQCSDDDDVVESAAKSIVSACPWESTWTGLAAVVQCLPDMDLRLDFECYPMLLDTLAANVQSNKPGIARASVFVLRRYFDAMGRLTWSHSDLKPRTVADALVKCFDRWGPGAAEDDPLSEASCMCVVYSFPSLIRSLTSAKPIDVRGVVSLLLPCLFQACKPPQKLRRIPIPGMRPEATSLARSACVQPDARARKFVGKLCVEVVLFCYEELPDAVGIISDESVAVLMQQMLEESSVLAEVVGKLLRTILLFDASNIVGATTGPEILSLAEVARPTHELPTHSVDEVGTGSTEFEISNILPAPGDGIDSVCEVEVGFEDLDGDEYCGRNKGEFRWARAVWDRLVSGRYRSISIGCRENQYIWGEGEALLDVHALVGMLDTPVCTELDGGTVDLTVDLANERYEKLARVRDSAPLDSAELYRSSLNLAHVSVMEAITLQLRRVQHQAGGRREAWMKLLPCAAGHLLASSRRDIRESAFVLLARMTSKPDLRVSLELGSFTNAISIQTLLSDTWLGPAIVRGTGDAVQLLSVLGTRYAFRSYLHIFRWIEMLLKSDAKIVDSYLRTRGQPQFLCMIEEYLLHWEDNRRLHQHIFSEATSRFLKTLGGLWTRLIASEDSSRQRKKHVELLDCVMHLHSCSDASVFSNWASLVSNVASAHGSSESQKDIVSGALSSPLKEFPGYSGERLAKAFGLPVPSSKIISGSAFPEQKHEGNQVFSLVGMRRIPIPSTSGPTSVVPRETLQRSEYSPTWASTGTHPQPNRPIPLSNADVTRLLKLQQRLQLPNKPMKSTKQRNALRARLGQNLGKSTRRVPAQAPRSAKGTSTNTDAPSLTLMQQKVEEFRKKREEELKKKNEDAKKLEGKETSAKSHTTHRQSSNLPVIVAEPAGGRKGPAGQDDEKTPVSEGIHSTKPNSAQLTAARFQALRKLKPRSLDDFHMKILNCVPSELVSKPSCLSNSGEAPERFLNAEEYVKFWEDVLFAELKAQISQSLESESRLIRSNDACSVDADSWVCRTPFEAVGPPESAASGRFKLLQLRFCGKGYLRDSCPSLGEGNRADSRDDFSAANLRSGDVVRVQMAKRGRGHVDGSHSSSDLAVVLGCVAKVEHRGPTSIITLKIRFPTLVAEPGPLRAFGISNLVSLVTHHRQMDALWRINTLSNYMLKSLFEPARAWKAKRAAGITNFETSRISVSRDTLLRKLTNRLNPSQLRVVRKSVEMVESASLIESEGFMLLQGPPGTGKTSTIIAILSSLLANTMAEGSNRARAREVSSQCNDIAFRVPVAPFRVLVCAPSNAAVDELLTRVMENGVMTPSGHHACPRLIRVGSGSKDDRVSSVCVAELVDQNKRFSLGTESLNDSESKTQEEQETMLKRDKLRGQLRGLSAEIGISHKKRLSLRDEYERHSVERKAMSSALRKKSDASFERDQEVLTRQLTTLHDKKQTISKALSDVEVDSKKIEQRRNGESAERISRIINQASIVFATLNSAGHESLSNLCGSFDAVIVDEAAQSVEPDVLIALLGAKRARSSGVKRCILVGDSKQLPATVLSTAPDVVKCLGRSLFERLEQSKYGITHMLNRQYRMHPSIAKFPSGHFYGGRLLNGGAVKAKGCWQPYHFDPAGRFGPVTFLDTSRCREAFESKSGSGSVANMGEAQLVVALISTLLRIYPDHIIGSASIAVLTPYRRQVGVIRRELANVRQTYAIDVDVNTVDGIQGQEKDIVILSTVRGGGRGSSRGIGFVKDPRRMNVALTRARHSLVVIGNAESLGTSSVHWSSYIAHCEHIDRLQVVPTIRQTFPEILCGSGNALLKPARVPIDDELPTFSDSDTKSDEYLADAEVLLSSDDESDIDLEDIAHMGKPRRVARRDSQQPVKEHTKKCIAGKLKPLGREGTARPPVAVSSCKPATLSPADAEKSLLASTACKDLKPLGESRMGTVPCLREIETRAVDLAPLQSSLKNTEVVDLCRNGTTSDVSGRVGISRSYHSPVSGVSAPVLTHLPNSVDESRLKRGRPASQQVAPSMASTVGNLMSPAAGRYKQPVCEVARSTAHESGRRRKLQTSFVPPPKRARTVGGLSSTDRDREKLLGITGDLKRLSSNARGSDEREVVTKSSALASSRPTRPIPKPPILPRSRMNRLKYPKGQQPVSGSSRYKQPVSSSFLSANAVGSALVTKPLKTDSTSWKASHPPSGSVPAAPKGGATAGAKAPGAATHAQARKTAVPQVPVFSLAASAKALDRTTSARRNIELGKGRKTNSG